MVRSFNGKIDLGGEQFTVGFMKQLYFATEEKTTAQTIGRKNKALEQNELMYFRHGFYDETIGERTTTYYCKFANAEKLRNKNLGERNEGKMANFRRSVSKRYSNIIKNPTRYELEEIEQLYSDLQQYNRDSSEAYRKDPQPILDIINALC